MRAILEIQSGSRTGHGILVAVGQSLEVGRSHLVDLSFPDDARMSGRHFTIQNDGGTCRIEDAGSTNGTFVNGQKVQTTILNHGDSVVAGETRFCIRLETATAEGPLAPTATMSREIPIAPAASGGQYTLEQCPSTVFCHRVAVSALAPKEIVRQLCRCFQTLLVVDPQKLTEQTRQQLTEVDYLFDWLPEETRSISSPLLLPGRDEPAELQLVDELWGQDALLCVCGPRDGESPVAAIRQAAGCFIRPSISVPQLTLSAETFARTMLTGIEAMLIEQPTADAWALYSLTPLQTLLSGFGLEETRGGNDPSSPQVADENPRS